MLAKESSWQQNEVKCLKVYREIIEYLISRSRYDLEEDLTLLDGGGNLSWGMRMATTYRSERMKILYS
jgi:hypothetical protein